jgi:hypothetical protein
MYGSSVIFKALFCLNNLDLAGPCVLSISFGFFNAFGKIT